jgi:hypothetical protein
MRWHGHIGIASMLRDLVRNVLNEFSSMACYEREGRMPAPPSHTARQRNVDTRFGFRAW